MAAAWPVGPKTETAHVFRIDGSVSVVTSFDKTIGGEALLPGFVFPLSTLDLFLN